MTPRGARRAAVVLGMGAAGAGAAACVRIETGPAGISSFRLDGVSPSVVVGDTLRDSLGVRQRLTVLAFGEGGEAVANPPVRFVYLPAGRDSQNRVVADTALVVDSLTGAVRATGTFVAQRGVVAAVIGDRLQVVDTLDVVPRPDGAVRDTALPLPLPLRYDCRNTLPALRQQGTDSTATIANAVSPFGVRVLGDSVGVRVPVRSRLVRWTVDSGPAVPAYRPPGGGAGDTVPAIGVIADDADRLLRYDTTDATGVSRVRLRIRPPALGPSAVSASTFTVRVRAEAQPGPVPIAGGVQLFRVTLVRAPLPEGQAAACQ